MQIEVHPAGKRHVRFAVEQALAGQMNGVERSGAGRIHRQTRPPEIENIGHPIGDGPGQRLGHAVISASFRIRSPQQVSIGSHPHINPHTHPLDILSAISGIFQSGPGNLQKESFLGIEYFGFPR